MSQEDFENWAQSHKARVEGVMETFITSRFETGTRLADAVRYAARTEGKRIRPLLAYAVAEVLDIHQSVADYPAAAIELLHTYSLVHDDLPAMDNDDLRRGKPTVHREFDEATAILVGDALLTHSFEFLASAPVDAELKVNWVQMLAKRAGVTGMIQGQSTDLEGESLSLTLPELELMHRQKSGALIEASLMMVAACRGDDAVTSMLEAFGHHVGLVFQIKDDILDVEGQTDVLGKRAGSDEQNEKSTFVSLLGVENSKARMKAEIEAAHEAIKPLHNTTALRWIADYIVTRKY